MVLQVDKAHTTECIVDLLGDLLLILCFTVQERAEVDDRYAAHLVDGKD